MAEANAAKLKLLRCRVPVRGTSCVLQQAWSEVEHLPIATPSAEAMVGRRQQAGRAARGSIAALLLVIAVFGAIAVRDGGGTTVTASDTRALERSLLDASDLGRGWMIAKDATTNTSSPCGSQVLDRLRRTPMATRSFALVGLTAPRVLAQNVYLLGNDSLAREGLTDVVDAVRKCSSYREPNPDGGDTIGTLAPAWDRGEDVKVYAGRFDATKGAGETSPGTAHLVILRSGPRLSLLLEATFGEAATPRSEVDRIIEAALRHLEES